MIAPRPLPPPVVAARIAPLGLVLPAPARAAAHPAQDGTGSFPITFRSGW
ncbi:hypothetical protein AB0M92_33865 [Streptomyces sp. NPDC051582]